MEFFGHQNASNVIGLFMSEENNFRCWRGNLKVVNQTAYMQILLLGTPFEMQIRVQAKFRGIFGFNAAKSEQI